MLLTYERFGAITLPIYDPSEPIGAFGARASWQDLPQGGAARGYGASRAVPNAREVRRIGTLLGASLAEVDTAFAALVAACGTVSRLYARRPDGTIVWTLAELSSVDALREPRTLFRGCPDVALDVETALTLGNPPWRGARHGPGWTFDSGQFFDAGLVFDEAIGDVYTGLIANTLTPCVVPNDGNATVHDAILEITAGSAAITGVVITSVVGSVFTQAHLVYSGSVPAGQVLRIDAGAQSIGVGAAGSILTGDYAHLTFGADHALAGWLDLPPGSITLNITVTSAQNATLTMRYSDGWA